MTFIVVVVLVDGVVNQSRSLLLFSVQVRGQRCHLAQPLLLLWGQEPLVLDKLISHASQHQPLSQLHLLESHWSVPQTAALWRTGAAGRWALLTAVEWNICSHQIFLYSQLSLSLYLLLKLQPILLSQKPTVRVISSSSLRSHALPLFAQFGILSIYLINDLQVAQFGGSPPCFSRISLWQISNVTTTTPVMYLNFGHLNHEAWNWLPPHR